MRRLILAVILGVAVAQMNSPEVRAHPFSQSAEDACLLDEVLLAARLTFSNGVMAEPGCYPIANDADVDYIERARRGGFVGEWPADWPFCRPVFLGVSAQYGELDSLRACALPESVVVVLPGAFGVSLPLGTAERRPIMRSIGVVTYAGPSPQVASAMPLGAVSPIVTPLGGPPPPPALAGGGRGGCGSRGGPGYRLANGRCASWEDAQRGRR